MKIATWRGSTELTRLALCGIGAAFAAVACALLLGSPAHASDDGDRGLLGSVTGILEDTTGLVGSTVSGVTSVATQTVDAVVQVAPAPVQQPLEAVSEVVTTVTAPVQQVVSSGVVSAVTQPVVEVVTSVPVVGEVVTGLGADHLVNQVGATVDDTLVSVVGAVEQTTEALTPPTIPIPTPVPGAVDPFPTLPGSGAVSGLDPVLSAFVSETTRPGADAALGGVASVPAFSRTTHESFTLATRAPAPSAAVIAADLRSGSAPPTSGPCAMTLSSSGPAGAGSGAWVLAALLPLAAHRAWVRRAGPEDDDTPPAPASSTDVSPD